MTNRPGILVLGLSLLLAAPALAEDPRQPIELPPEVRDAFLAEMRTHLANLDDIVAALASGDFDEAAQVAEIKMAFGHYRWQAMSDAGATDEEIAEAKERFGQPGTGRGTGPGMGAGMGRGMGMMGPGFGRYMPDDFRAMGFAFHDATQAFAETARAVGDPPTTEDYQAVLDALWNVTVNCRGCHDAFRVAGG